MTDDEIERGVEEIHELFDDVREALAEDLGGDPDDYRTDQPVADGGE